MRTRTSPQLFAVAPVPNPRAAATAGPPPPTPSADADLDPDFALLDAWAAGDHIAGNRVVDRHYFALFRFFFNKIDAATEELVRRSFRSALKHRHRSLRALGFRTYLLANARDVLALQHSRAAAKHEEEGGVPEEIDAAESSMIRTADASQRDALLLGLRGLPLDDQIALELELWEKLTAPQMAVVVGRSERELHRLLRRARTAMRDRVRTRPDAQHLLMEVTEGVECWVQRLRELAASTH